MDTLEALSARLATTRDIRSIVSTMKALSSANIHQYERAVEAMRDFERAVTLGLQIVLRGSPRDAVPRPTQTGGHRRALIVIGSDRGLCGRFNDRIAEFARLRLTPRDDAPPAVLCVLGLRAAARLEAAGHRADPLFALPGSVGGLTGTVQAVTIAVDRWTTARGVAEVEVVFNRRSGAMLAEPVAQTLLPVPDRWLEDLAARPWPSPRLPTYRMDRGRLFSWLIRQHLFVVLYRALASSLASEHASRLAAMQGAERNIDERLDDLQSAFAKKRQETITRELLDLVAGFETLRGRD